MYPYDGEVPREVVENIAHKAIDDFIPYLQGRMAMLPVDILLQIQVAADDFKDKVITSGLALQEKE